MMFFKLVGKSEKGGIWIQAKSQFGFPHHIRLQKHQQQTCRVKGPQSRMTATLLSFRASVSTTAFTKCVVPMATLRISLRSTLDWDKTSSIAVRIPDVTSILVRVFLDAQTPRDTDSMAVMSIMAASVLVPPTSTPIRYAPIRVMTGLRSDGIQFSLKRSPILYE